MKKVMIKSPTPNYCNKCGDTSIELYTANNRPLYYSVLLNRIERGEDIDLLESGAKYFMCRKCKTEYRIMWANKFPYPMRTDNMVNIFLNSIKGE